MQLPTVFFGDQVINIYQPQKSMVPYDGYLNEQTFIVAKTVQYRLKMPGGDGCNAMEWKLCALWFAGDILDGGVSTVYRNELSASNCD